MAEASLPPDERMLHQLAAYDDELAVGGAQPPDGAARDDLACLQLLNRLRPRVPAPVPDPAPLADPDARCYELERLHAAGGMGQVWLARDPGLGRTVALKELRPERAADPAMVARFLREAEITSRLQHPGVVPVYELVAGADGEPPFYTMRFVQGRTLTEAAHDYHASHATGATNLLGLIRLLNAFVSVCHTIAYAHSQGVIHRDLKGFNVVLGDFGEVIVLDWGFGSATGEPASRVRAIASRLEAAPDGLPDATQPGQVMGTPAYMAPEQAAGRLDCIDARTDIFGLGAILYEVLTGQAPFTGADTAEVLRKARACQTAPVRSLRPGVARALAAVCEKAMAPAPADRYASAADLARDVQHWLADEPTAAYREPWPVRVMRWGRQHKSALAALVVLALMGGAGAALVAEVRIQVSRAESAARAAADSDVKRRLEGQLYIQHIALADRELSANNLGRGRALLAACPEPLRGWEWAYLNAAEAGRQVLHGHREAVSAVSFSNEGRLLASASHDGTIRLWQVDAGRVHAVLEGHSATVYDVAFSPNGRLLASASWDGSVRLWDVTTQQPVQKFTEQSNNGHRLAFSPDGRLLASVGSERVFVRRVAGGEVVFSIGGSEQDMLFRVAFHPDGARLAVSRHSGVQVWDIAARRLVFVLPGENRYLKCVAFSPDGRLLATGEGDLAHGDPGVVRLWRADDGQFIAALDAHTEPVWGLAFSPDGDRLFSASQDKTIKVWDVNTYRETLTLRGHADTVRGLALSPDGRRLASAGADGTVRLWNALPGPSVAVPHERATLAGHSEAVFGVTFSPDGRRLASLSSDAEIKIWDVTARRQPFNFRLPPNARSGGLVWSPDGLSLAAANSDGKVYLLDAGTGEVRRTYLGHEAGPIKSVAFAPGGAALATAGWDRSVRVWPIAGGEPLVLRGHTDAVLGVAFSPDGQWLASAGYDNSVRIWDAASGAPLQTLVGHTSRVAGVAVSRSGALLATAGNDDVVRVWATASWAPTLTLRGHAAGVTAVAFGPTDRYLASASLDHTVKVWDLTTGTAVRTYRGHADRVRAVAFSPDGHLLASGGHDRLVKLWAFEPAPAKPAEENARDRPGPR